MADAQLEHPCQLDWIWHLRSALTAIRSPRLGRTIREPVVSSARSCQAPPRSSCCGGPVARAEHDSGLFKNFVEEAHLICSRSAGDR